VLGAPWKSEFGVGLPLTFILSRNGCRRMLVERRFTVHPEGRILVKFQKRSPHNRQTIPS
jgi:hypothetical protein